MRAKCVFLWMHQFLPFSACHAWPFMLYPKHWIWQQNNVLKLSTLFQNCDLFTARCGAGIMDHVPRQDNTDQFLQFMPSWVTCNTSTVHICNRGAKVSFYCACQKGQPLVEYCSIANCKSDVEIAQKLASVVQSAHGGHNHTHEAPDPGCFFNLPATHSQPAAQPVVHLAATQLSCCWHHPSCNTSRPPCNISKMSSRTGIKQLICLS